MFKDLSSLKNTQHFEQFIRAKSQSNSKVFKHLEKFLQTENLRISQVVRSRLFFKLVTLIVYQV